jgi:hypothetical protein
MARTDPRPHYGTKRRTRTDGYVDIYDPAHPLARRDGYVAEHRRMAWDAGLLTDPAHDVHHKNEIKTDNRLDNFEIKTHAGHALDHVEGRGWIINQYGIWEVKAPGRRANAPRPERCCPWCGGGVSLSKRRDAIYCKSSCRISAWKAEKRRPTHR